MASLYELTAGYMSMLDAYDGAETEEEREAILARMTGAEDFIGEKAEAYAKIIKMKEAEAEGFRKEAERLTERRRAAENVVKRLKAALFDAMTLTGATEIKTSIGRWRIQDNPLSCEIVDIDKIPMEYRIRQEDKIDKKGLIDHYKQTGEIIDGCEFRQEQGIRFR